MSKEMKAQTKVGVGIEVLWRAWAKDLTIILQKVAPKLVRNIELLEGDGGLGTIMLLNFGPDVTTVTYQKEQIVEFDDAQHRFGLQVIEGGHLNLGFASYKTFFQLTEMGETETLVDITVIYETKTDEAAMPQKTIKSTLVFIKCLETYLLHSNNV